MEIHDLKIRVSGDVKDWLRARAQTNRRTLNGEVLLMLETAMKAEEKPVVASRKRKAN